MGFADSVKLSAEKMQGEVNSKIVDVAQQLFTSIVVATPVNQDPHAKKRGELKNNWMVGQGIDNYNRTYTASFDEDGSASLTQIASFRGSTLFEGQDNEISLTNIVPYGYKAEVTGWPLPWWTGRVGPYAMVRNSMLEIVSKLK